MDATILAAALAYSRNLGAHWARERAIEAARASLPECAPYPHLPTRAERAIRSAADRMQETGDWATRAANLIAEGVEPNLAVKIEAMADTIPASPPWLGYDGPDVSALRVDAPSHANGYANEAPAIPGGWKAVRLSGAPHSAIYSTRYLHNGLPVVTVGDDGRVRWHASDEEAHLRRVRKAKAAEHHAVYLSDLKVARAAVAADPALRFTLETVLGCGWAQHEMALDWERRAQTARVCLALAGWLHDEGQEGGVVWPPMCECRFSGLSLKGVLKA